MRSILALLRVSYLTAASYRLGLVISFVGLIVSVIPLYFVSGALQPVVAESIAAEGGDYFGFLLVGLAATYVLSAAVSSLPGAIGGSLGNGTFEALLVTRTPLRQTLAGLSAYPLLLASVRSLVLLAAVAVSGVPLHWSGLPLGAIIIALIAAAYYAFGLFGAALILAFRTAGPLSTAVITLSGLLGGVYYSTAVIPAWLQDLSAFVPLTYGLRALRMVLLGGAPFPEIMNDLGALTFFATVLLSAGVLSFALALRHARSAGTLSQY